MSSGSELSGRITLLLSAMLVFSSAAQAEDPMPSAKEKNAESIARELERCPLWTQVPERDLATRNHVTQIYLRLAQYETETVRDGIGLYLNPYVTPSRQSFDANLKVFALVRVIFKVPARFRAGPDGVPFYLYGNPVYADGVDLLWPFSINRNGGLALTGVDLELHTGLAYRALPDFDKMASHFERRFPAR